MASIKTFNLKFESLKVKVIALGIAEKKEGELNQDG